MFGTFLALSLVLLPPALDVPGSETLVTRVITCEVTVLLEALLLVSARDEIDFLIVAHDSCGFA